MELARHLDKRVPSSRKSASDICVDKTQCALYLIFIPFPFLVDVVLCVFCFVSPWCIFTFCKSSVFCLFPSFPSFLSVYISVQFFSIFAFLSFLFKLFILFLDYFLLAACLSESFPLFIISYVITLIVSSCFGREFVAY